MKKLFNKKGFTLAELLIVVAIIAVLVAIAIPVFTSAVERAAVSADAANIRAAYAELQIAAIDPTYSSSSSVTTFVGQSNASTTANSKDLTSGTFTVNLPAEADGAYGPLKGKDVTVTIVGDQIHLALATH